MKLQVKLTGTISHLIVLCLQIHRPHCQRRLIIYRSSPQKQVLIGTLADLWTLISDKMGKAVLLMNFLPLRYRNLPR